MTRLRIREFLFFLTFALSVLQTQERVIDYRFAPDYYHTPIGFVDDWQKTMVNEKGSLLYDFGPGPYVRPNTVIGVGLKGLDLKLKSQRLEHARIPIVITELSRDNLNLRVQSFAIVPRASHSTKAVSKYVVHRRLGLNGALAWAKPEGEVDPAFRNVAWGTNRPIMYEIDVQKRSKKKVALGFCESYRQIPSLRMMELHVEGSPVTVVDPIAMAARNSPLVSLFNDAWDVNGDGRLAIEVRPSSQCRDPNVILNAVWMFAANEEITEEEIISGRATRRAEVYLDCGRESEVQNLPTRIDALLLTSDSRTASPVVAIQTTRQLAFNQKSRVLECEGRPFVSCRPKPLSAQKTENGWELELPKGTAKAEVIVIHGYRVSKNAAEVPNLMKERARTVRWWEKESGIMQGRLTIPDAQLQHLFDASVRTLYQNRDLVDGFPQFQPGSTVYRGLWIHDGVYYIEAAAILGDTMSARLATEELFRFQQPDGKVQVMWPIEMQRESPMMVWVMERYARLANNPAWLRSNWARVYAAMDYTRRQREQTLVDPSSPYYGLMPPGFVDGGISGLTADYCSVFWTLIGIRSAIDMALWLGKTQDQHNWHVLYDDLLTSFRQAARRDMKRDRFGHEYLPVRVADTTTTDVPQRAQWAICEAIFLSSLFPPGDSLAEGSLAVIDSTCIQGLPSSFGWMTGGIGVWFAPLYGLAHLARGNVDRTVNILYAFANHATPHGAWAEEQMPKGVSSRTTGDFPTTSATACMLRSSLALMAFEHGNSLEVLRGIPKEWLFPGSAIHAKDLRTKFGKVSIEVSVSKDGRTCMLLMSSVGHGDRDEAMAQYTDDGSGFGLSLRAFKEAGFRTKEGGGLPDRIPVRWGEKLEMEFHQ